MTGSHTDPPTPAGHDDAAPTADRDAAAHRRRTAWRVGTPVVVLLSGALFAVSATNSEGTDLRPGRYTDLASLVQNEADAYEDLQAEVADLGDQVDQLTRDVDDAQVQRKRRQAEDLRDPAGLEARTGSGVTVVLSDAPDDVLDEAVSEAVLDINRLVVHQQDIQAVVNAMWNGGATAVTIQGQRVVTTTGIKCEGNAVTLQGVPYPQPYTISAVGDPDALEAALDGDADVAGFRADADRPDVAVGWELDTEEVIEAPAYEGLLDISYATPVR